MHSLADWMSLPSYLSKHVDWLREQRKVSMTFSQRLVYGRLPEEGTSGPRAR
jgi:hypothetical protein